MGTPRAFYRLQAGDADTWFRALLAGPMTNPLIMVGDNHIQLQLAIPANATAVPASDHSIGNVKSSAQKSGKSELKRSQEATKNSTSSRDRTTAGSSSAATDARSEDTQTSQQRSDTAAASDSAPTPGAGGKTR